MRSPSLSRPEEAGRRSVLLYIAVCALTVVVLVGAFFLYRMSITQAVDGATASFMAQLADHDAQAVNNQMSATWGSLESLVDRMRITRESEREDVSYLLGVETQATSFDRILLVTDDGSVHDSTYLVSALDEAPWAQAYRDAGDHFAVRYSLEDREKWGEYLAYGVKLAEPLSVEGATYEGVVGLVPLDDVENSMRLESFDGQGTAIVIQPSGAIVTASEYYGGPDGQSYFSELEQASFVQGSYEQCVDAIRNERDAFVEYVYDGTRYSAMMKPISNSDWTIVVKTKSSVTASQVNDLMTRSIIFFGVLGVIVAAVLMVIYRSVRSARIARESEKAKSAFLANMSHEIRTPLNGIVGLQYLMRQNLDDREKLEAYLDQADVSAEFLKSVITDVLDMSKIESGQMDLHAEPFDLAAMLGDIQTLVSQQASARKLAFVVDVGELEAPCVLGDEMRIKQALVNLLGNAIKFTPEGGTVRLEASQHDGDGEGVVVTEFVVADTGCGMSPEFLARIWEPFEQERRMTSQSGTGLGTSLSKVIVEAMDGTIAVESELDEGTTFTVRLPLPPVEGEAALRAQADVPSGEVALEGMRVLVAEDNDVNRMIIVDILGDEGCEVTEARDGREAVEAFEAAAPGAFDVVLMDLQMPTMNGYQATEAIRALGRDDATQVLIMALTANAFREDIDRARACGMNDVITKPLDVDRLLAKLKEHEARRQR